MRTMIERKTLIFSLLLAALFFTLVPMRSVTQALYPLVRGFAEIKLSFETRALEVYETEHYIIKYHAEDSDIVNMVATAAEAAYMPVTGFFNEEMKKKTMLVIYPDRKELNSVFGWSGDQSAMGVYWGGVIQLLSPKEWLEEGQTIQDYIKLGPLVHEFTHLILDYKVNGNYPRWFTEGLAQYVEYQVNGYEWLSRTNNLKQNIYSQEDLDKNFDELADQSRAYRQAYAAVNYIAKVHGENKLLAIINELEQGKTAKTAISNTLNMTYQDFYSAWTTWAQNNMV